MKKQRKLVGQMVQVVLRFSPEVDAKIQAIAEEEERSYASVVRRAVADWLAKRELKTIQRVSKLAPTSEATDALLEDGLHSARRVYRLGESEFVRRYGRRPGALKKGRAR